MIPANKQAGAALLSILLIVATLSVAALIATEAIVRQTDLHKLSSRRTMATWAARSAEAAALSSVTELIAGSRLPATGDVSNRKLSFALPVEGGQIVLNLREQPACLNLNALANTDTFIRLQQTEALRLLMVDIGIAESSASSLIAMMSDWVDADGVEQPGGAEDAYYASRETGFRTANQPLRSLRELSALPGFTTEMQKALSAFTCVVPGADPAAINVNALTPESAPVLRAATQGVFSLAEARRFIEARPAKGWASPQDVRAYVSGRPDLEPAFSLLRLSVEGEYFIGEGDAVLDAGTWPFRFLLQKKPDGTAAIVWRSFGDAG